MTMALAHSECTERNKYTMVNHNKLYADHGHFYLEKPSGELIDTLLFPIHAKEVSDLDFFKDQEEFIHLYAILQPMGLKLDYFEDILDLPTIHWVLCKAGLIRE